MEAAVAVGSVVYLNPDTLKHDAALAQWQDLESAGGRLTPDPTAVYTGVVCSKPGANAGDILIDGFGVLDATGLSNLFGTSTPDVGLPVTHTHRNYDLQEGNWLDSTFFDTDIVPDGATYGYNFNATDAVAQNLGETLLPAVGEASFIYLGEATGPSGSSSGIPASQCAKAGLHVGRGFILLDQNGIWWFDVTPPECDLEMTVTSADTKGKALIHAIENLTPESLDITTLNGRTKIGDRSFEDVSDSTAGHLVIKGLNGREVSKGPVVEAILAGAGITATSNNPGVRGQQGIVSIRNTANEGTFLAASLLNLNNAVTDVDAPYVFTLFPTGRNSQVTVSLTLPNFGDLKYQAVLWAQFLTPGASQAGPVVASYLASPAPDADGVTPAALAATFPAFPAAITAGDLYLLESDPVEVTPYSKGTLFFTLEADNPTDALKMVNLGVRLIVLDS
jgi:hypothetical protein